MGGNRIQKNQKKTTMKKSTILRRLLIACLFIASSSQLFAQLKGITYTFSPSAEYIFSHKNSGLSNGFAAGGQLGFGFGEYIRLNANYSKTLGSTSDFATLLGTGSLVAEKDASLSRFGGEFKANLSRSRVAPFLALGTGVQTVSTDNTDKSNQIYLSSSAGLNIRIDDRINLAFELLNTSYRINAVNTYMTAAERAKVPASKVSATSDIVSDISGKVRLSLFLGGKRPGTLSDMDLAYLSQFGSGFKGLSVALEPMLMRVNFNSDLPFTNAWYTGLSTGFDFGPYVGIRAFYLNSFDDDSFISLGKSVIWGGETKFKLNSSEGMIPYLTLGGGRIDALSGYKTPNNLTAENKVFASGGLGIEMPLSRNIKIAGFAKSMLTSVGDPKNLSQPEDIVSSMAYGLKIGFLLGKKPESAQNLLDTKLGNLKAQQQSEYELEREKLVTEYDRLLQQKNEELKLKSAIIDTLTKAKAIKEKQKVAPVKPVKAEVAPENIPDKSFIRVTPEELVVLIRELKSAGMPQAEKVVVSEPRPTANDTVKALPTITETTVSQNPVVALDKAKVHTVAESTGKKDTVVIKEIVYNTDTVYVEKKIIATAKSDSIELRLKSLEKIVMQANEKLSLINTNSNQGSTQLESLVTSLKEQLTNSDLLIQSLNSELKAQRAANESLEAKLNEFSGLNSEVSSLSKQVKKLENTIDYTENVLPARYQSGKSDSTNVKINMPVSGSSGINYINSSVFGGINLGESTSFNVGLRWKYGIAGSDFNIVPETYLGIGSSAYFGLFINSTYDLNFGIRKGFSPYIGTGLGLMKTQNSLNEDVFKGAFNLILGTELLKFSNGSFYVDFTIRNLFKYNQLTVGYNLPF